MRKAKTKKSLTKRFKFSAKGKIKRSHAYKGHLLSKKGPKRKRSLRKSSLISKSDRKRVRRLMPYG